MHNPTLYIDSQKLTHNVKSLLALADKNQIDIHFVTKCIGAYRPILEIISRAGAKYLADSRLENIAQFGDLTNAAMLLRTPMLSEVRDVVRLADISLNSELATLAALSDAAGALEKRHGVILMVEMGDLREGFLPEEMMDVTAEVLNLRNIDLVGIGANFNSYGGIIPDEDNLFQLAMLSQDIKRRFNIRLPIVSGGSSGSVYLMEEGKLPVGINHLRIGETWLFGTEASYHKTVGDLNTDVFRLEAEVIECRRKDSIPSGIRGTDAFGERQEYEDRGTIRRAILALGVQDVPFEHLTPKFSGVDVLGSSSDHVLLDVTNSVRDIRVGDTLQFSPDYRATLALFTSPYVRKVII